MREELAKSYGFNTVPAFTRESALRIFQRGIERGAGQALGSEAASILQPTRTFANKSIHWWNIDTEVFGVQIVEQEHPHLQIDAVISISEHSLAAEPGQILWRVSCRAAAPRRDELDGYWAHTLEDAGSMLVNAAVKNTSSTTTSCRPLGKSGEEVL